MTVPAAADTDTAMESTVRSRPPRRRRVESIGAEPVEDAVDRLAFVRITHSG